MLMGTAVLQVTCELTGILIDEEANDLTPDTAAGVCAARLPRMHGLGSGKDRLPWAHAAVQQAWELGVSSGNEHLVHLLGTLDQHRDDVFVDDKQSLFWLMDYVKYKSPSHEPGTERHGANTPASLVLRACDAFSTRPALAVPDVSTFPHLQLALPRQTPLTALTSAAAVQLTARDGFLWLTYAHVGMLVRRVAKGLLGLGLPPGSYVAIAGYNDFEWAIADFAVAVAGFVSVGVHSTYSSDEAAAVISKVKCAALLCMLDHTIEARRVACGRFSVQQLRQQCPCLLKIVVMDAPSGGMADASFMSFVCREHESRVQLPDPFRAHGAECSIAGGSAQQRVSTVLFTSGSSGTPKAVAVGVDAFVVDICGSKGPEEVGTSQSCTVSYIPLSHGSDRYKLWSHIVHGGRVGFCQFGAENWAWREADKSTQPGASQTDSLFSQVAICFGWMGG